MVPLMIRAALSGLRRMPDPLPRTTIDADGRPLDEEAYATWLGTPDALTSLYPRAQSVHLERMLSSEIALPVLGMVHASNTIACVSLPSGSAAMRLTLEEIDPIAGRRALRLTTRWSDGDTVNALMESVYVMPAKVSHTKRPPTQPPPSMPAPRTQWVWNRGAGRTYARVSGDYNPIHLAAPLARAFGQRGTILHGMAIAAFAWRDAGANSAFQEISFRKPVVLPARTQLRVDAATGEFWVTGADNIVHARGLHADLAAARTWIADRSS